MTLETYRQDVMHMIGDDHEFFTDELKLAAAIDACYYSQRTPAEAAKLLSTRASKEKAEVVKCWKL